MPLDSSTNSESAIERQGPLVPVTARGQATRRKLLDAAEGEFGDRGFHVASVSSITGRAGVGQGTFYLYFHTKEEIFVTLVEEIGRSLRSVLREALEGGGTRMDRDRAAIASFHRFSVENPGRFRIVQEAQFVDQVAFRDYYERLAADYAESLRVAAERGEIAQGDAYVRSWALLGMMHFLGLRNSLSGADTSQPDSSGVDALAAMVEKGLQPAA